jgi:2-haloacid dehalogenase
MSMKLPAIEASAIEAIVFDAYGTLYDVQSVAAITEEAFPGHGDFITQVWRLKQLEYTWLRALMDRYEDFWTVTKEALSFTLAALGLEADAALFARIAEAYNTLAPYPDAAPALRALVDYRLAILSNGSPDMLHALVRNSGLDALLEHVISVDARKTYKPAPRAYTLVEARIGRPPGSVLFVSSNGFDIAGAKNFGFTVARIERVTPAVLTAELAGAAQIGPASLFKALRTQAEYLGAKPDFVIGSLSELAALASDNFGRPR